MGKKKGSKQSPVQDLEEAKDEELKDVQKVVKAELLSEESLESEDSKE
jgi:hypothetical protein